MEREKAGCGARELSSDCGRFVAKKHSILREKARTSGEEKSICGEENETSGEEKTPMAKKGKRAPQASGAASDESI